MNPLNIRIIPRTLHFRQPAGTSRGVYTTRNVWYILIRDNTTGRIGYTDITGCIHSRVKLCSCGNVEFHDTYVQRVHI